MIEPMKFDPLTDAELDDLEKVCTAATPGPWCECGKDRGGCVCRLIWSEPVDDVVAQTRTGTEESLGLELGPGRYEDAVYIARFNPKIGRRLIDEVRRNRKMIADALDLIRIREAGRGVTYADDVLADVGEILEGHATTGHWTRTPPTEPGWYKTIVRSRAMIFVRLFNDGKNGLELANGKPVENVDWWWSEPEMLPVPPPREK